LLPSIILNFWMGAGDYMEEGFWTRIAVWT
jgi:hypothetical protein